MSYLLGSGAVGAAPCLLTHLAGRELARLAPCVCLHCCKLVPRPQQQVGPRPRLLASVAPPTGPAQQFPALQVPAVRPDLAGPAPPPGPAYTRTFSESYSGVGGHSIQLQLAVAPHHTTGLSYRFLHTSPPLTIGKKSSSKVEETVNRLKEKQNEKLIEISRVEDLEKKIASVIEADDMAVKVKVEKTKLENPDRRTVTEKIVAEVKHYYSGFKLLFLDVKVSSKIIWRVSQGKTLSRRENRQLVRTVSDLFRLVPFSVFIIIPFMELLLPVALKLFPGMLPSTFTSADERENKMRRQLKAKLEYARFLQKTLDEMGPRDKGHWSKSASEFVHFFNSVKKTGAEEVTNKDILKFSKLFEDEITLDNMTRGQLVAICRLLELTPIGTNAFLRFQIEMQVRKLKADDVLIAKEGVEQMTVTELQSACKDRGMRALGITQEKLVLQLKQWIELSTNEKVPPSLLLLSRTLYLPETIEPAKAIEASISALPETVATGAKAKLGEREGKIENVTRLEVIKQEQQMIEQEQKDQERLQEEKRRKAEEEKARQEKQQQLQLEKAIEEQSLGVVPSQPPTAESVVREASSVLRRATVSQDGDVSGDGVVPLIIQTGAEDIHLARAEVIQESVPVKEKKSLLEQELSVSDLSALRSAIDAITKEKGKTYVSEHEVLSELKQEMVDYEEDLEEMKEVSETTGRKNLKQTKGAARLFTRMNKMLGRADAVVKKLAEREKKLLDSLGKVGESSEDQEEHLVTVQDLLGAVRGLQKVPDSRMLERISEVVASMDEDSDGVVKLEHVNKVIEILGSDNVELSGKQVKQIIDLIGKEEMLEVESRIEKILGKIPVIESESDVGAVAAETVITKDITESAGDKELVDPAVDMSTDNVEQHIAEMFTRETSEELQTEKMEPVQENDIFEVSRTKDDTTVKEISNSLTEQEDLNLKIHEEEPVKVPQKNGSK